MSLVYSSDRTSRKLSIFTQWKIRWFMKRREAIGYQYTYLEQADCKIYVTRLSYHLLRIRVFELSIEESNTYYYPTWLSSIYYMDTKKHTCEMLINRSVVDDWDLNLYKLERKEEPVNMTDSKNE